MFEARKATFPLSRKKKKENENKLYAQLNECLVKKRNVCTRVCIHEQESGGSGREMYPKIKPEILIRCYKIIITRGDICVFLLCFSVFSMLLA